MVRGGPIRFGALRAQRLWPLDADSSAAAILIHDDSVYSRRAIAVKEGALEVRVVSTTDNVSSSAHGLHRRFELA